MPQLKKVLIVKVERKAKGNANIIRLQKTPESYKSPKYEGFRDKRPTPLTMAIFRYFSFEEKN
jgi:hypothetical protein